MERLLASGLHPGEQEIEASLRPQSLAEYIGQEHVKNTLSIFIAAAKARGEALDHVLLCGPPGLGKTTLATIIARELGVPLRITSGPAIERPGDMAAILTSLQPKEVLFIDEIHRLPRSVEEILYPAMEDFGLDIVLGKGPGARTLRLALPRFTLVGATTRTGLLTSPLRERFGITARLEFYNPEELAAIVERSAALLKLKLEPDAAREIARRSRGTPRVANRLLKRVRDYAQVKARGVITLDVAREALELLEVDEAGLDTLDRRLLSILIERFGGGPVGLDALAAALSEDPGTLEDVYEPYLLQMGYLKRTPRGRVATELAYRHLGKEFPGTEGAQLSLFGGSTS